ncbi:DUF3892 domain-containing protein [Myxococcus sp. CA051A]|uniref:DUF3892 domain-containing protein n=1 Tax=unclassified Myxococcus TaxID=2648731 RepID=UPI00157A58D4|nr:MULTISPECIES: DUF3892 domain-containing protein [unclassified Myxococcus]NTX16504.1 DUF3892 domain-containing protein [Myxococcus sp. CA056]NTX38682.1 DUF3892 domain-containing protein [Myxococcus sp. CA033]NTX56173.1 DUF3892 domain-containing protein [Myxococcus sp. CA039A]NTX62751.1 DUF3892 domain-containing protein [Myxococcus sp. CA051A]
MRYITHIHLEGGRRLEHIALVRWREGLMTGTSTRQQMVEWIDDGGDARVQALPVEARVEVVNARPPYLRSVPNGSRFDNLLSLPEF